MPPQLASLPQPAFGSSPMMRPSGNPGNAANGAAMVREAVDMLEKALSDIPPDHPLHKMVLDSIGKLSKAAPLQAASPGVGLTALKQQLAQAQQQSPLAALLAGARGGGAQPGAPGGGAPPTIPMPTPPGGGGPTPPPV